MTQTQFIRRTILVVGIVVFTAVLLLLVQQIFSIILIGFLCWIISVGLDIPVMALRRRGLSHGASVAITLLGAALVIVIFVIIVLPPLLEQTTNLVSELPNAVVWLVREYGNIRENNDVAAQILPPFTVEDYNAALEAVPVEVGATPAAQSGSYVDLGSVLSSTVPVIIDFGGYIFNVIINLFMVIFISIYLVADPLVYYRIAVALTPRHYEVRIVEIINELRASIVAWLSALAVSMSFTSVMVFVVIGLILNVPNAIALAVLAGIANIIPYVGYWLALLPIGLFALVSVGPTTALIAVGAYILIGEIESKAVSPTVIKNELNIPAGVTLLFQLITASLLGFFGILLAVPLLAMASVLLKELFVHDSLGKERIAAIGKSPDGKLYLDYGGSPPKPRPVSEQTLVTERKPGQS